MKSVFWEFLFAKAYLKDKEADDKLDKSKVVLTNSSTDPGIAAELSSLTAYEPEKLDEFIT